MKIIYTRSYDNSVKKLKKKYKETEKLNTIIDYIINKRDFFELSNDPVAKLYGFERLKHQYNEYYSFRLSKIIRLIVKPNGEIMELYFIYVSTDHYEDFDESKVKYYDE